MKFFHISDLHIGKRVNGFSMLEDQKYILGSILKLVREHRPDGVWIAGDLYDKSMPSAEAVETADWFLSQLAAQKVPVWVISGNHDSAERVAYAGKMLEQAGVYVSRIFDGKMQGYCVQKKKDGKVSVAPIQPASEVSILKVNEAEQKEKVSGSKDMQSGGTVSGSNNMQSCRILSEAEKIYIWLLPYLRPAQVRRFFPQRQIETTQQAVQAVLESSEIPQDGVNVLLMHQFLAGADVCDSEELSVGGLDQVDASAVDAFDYVALGHLHRPQSVGRESVRYCGSPLKYSFSEAGHKKSVTVVEIMPQKSKTQEDEACENELRETAPQENEPQKRISVSTLPLVPRLDMREIRGPFETIMKKEIYALENREDYLHITLTDQEGILDAIGKLREVYPNIMKLDFAQRDTLYTIEETEILVEEKTPQELFEEFFERQNGRKMSEEQRRAAVDAFEKAAEKYGCGKDLL